MAVSQNGNVERKLTEAIVWLFLLHQVGDLFFILWELKFSFSPESHWEDMRVIILVANDHKKDVGSTEGMQKSLEGDAGSPSFAV
jgi:hypothetical protein